MRIWFAMMLLCLPLAVEGADEHTSLVQGAGHYLFHDPVTQQSVTVYYYQPHNYSAETPVVLVLHGLRRDAREYRDSWAEYAEREGLMVLAPRFSAEVYPGGNGYNLGNVFQATSTQEIRGRTRPQEINPPENWAFTLVERLFTDFRMHSPQGPTTYYLYGHGAGAQFAHRFAMFMPDSQAQEIIVAAAGWYTMPDPSIEWPYGTGGVPMMDPEAIKSFLAQPLLLLAGGADTTTLHTVMRQTPEANAQGVNRVERTRNYYAFAERQARDAKLEFNWRQWVMPGVTHSPEQMTPFAARYIALQAR
ncbi:hypothetical protein [Halomonas huangheensis]|uniref:AB hydrolase-1 domain-containing protein n=1 Tax=Halomonas huangheensis TaxID=1178482 RepID=W1N7J6_9GAMM|nr:hypothetical protein [Halomonas huangheensis]ALM51080.1 hypothetical protein AR456_01300 [Halomonas huangheensis]ERL51166.1 hypothetical protein BJB45_14780 [Halomonas huangheensis]